MYPDVLLKEKRLLKASRCLATPVRAPQGVYRCSDIGILTSNLSVQIIG